MARIDGREPNQLRHIQFTRDFTKNSMGCCFVEFGETKVLCTASVDSEVPRFLRGENRGWVTAEYSLLPGSSPERVTREATRGRQTGRTQEIQRLIGRSLRSVCDMEKLGERQIILDCDVLQADGGTRTASICGAYLALSDAVKRLERRGDISVSPLTGVVSAISVGVVDGINLLDLNYIEDSNSQVDMNVVMTDREEYIEIQGTAEKNPFSRSQLEELLNLASFGIDQILDLQRDYLTIDPV